MSLKGLLYPKTTFSYEERPVSSNKLNIWNDRIESGFSLLSWLLNQALGGGDGIISGAAAEDLEVQELATPGMRVRVQPGYAFISGCPYELAVETDTPLFAAPETHNRVDLVQARLEDWSIEVKPGEEAATPSAPSPSADCIALAEITLRPAMTCIKDDDDGTNGLITDVREFL